jgi:hypothetical protein
VDESDRARPPPIVKSFAGPGAVVDAPEHSVWQFRWSTDGESVALVRDGVVVALIVSGQRRGHSAAIAAECPWGAPLRDEHLAAAGVG